MGGQARHWQCTCLSRIPGFASNFVGGVEQLPEWDLDDVLKRQPRFLQSTSAALRPTEFATKCPNSGFSLPQSLSRFCQSVDQSGCAPLQVQIDQSISAESRNAVENPT